MLPDTLIGTFAFLYVQRNCAYVTAFEDSCLAAQGSG